MSTPQILFTVALIVVLLSLAGYYTWRQWQALLRLRTEEIAADERRYLRHQVWRRLAGSGLMVVFASLLAGSFFIEGRAQALADRVEAARASGEEFVPEPGDREFRRFWAIYWIVLLLGVLLILGLAAYDFLATRRFGLRHYRQLQADRRAMLQRELATLRRERNGHG